MRGPSAADLVQVFGAAYDEDFIGGAFGEGFCEDGEEGFLEHADDAGFDEVVAGVRERAEEVEDGAESEFLADGRDVAHAGVEARREEEGVVGGGVELGQALGGDGFDVWGLGRDGLEEVGAPGGAAGGAVAVFGDEEEGGGEEGGGGGDVEGAVTVAAGAHDVDEAAAVGAALEVAGADGGAEGGVGGLGGGVAHAGGAFGEDEGVAVEVGGGEEGEEGGGLDWSEGVGED